MFQRIFAVVFWVSCASAQSPIPAGAVLEKITTGYKFTEGPVWTSDNALLFSDVQAGTIYRWSAADSTTSVYMRPSDSSNGLTFDMQGRLVLTQMAKRRVARRESDGSITPLVSTDKGRKFNSPNDIVVRSDGSIYFTDPDFNTPVGQKLELPYKGVYRLSPKGVLQLIDSTFNKPNGICLSPDEKQLYVNESPLVKIYSWNIVNDSTVSGKKLLYTIPAAGYADGMKTDSAGNIYCAGPGGVWIVSPGGASLGKITTPESPTNCAWGGKDRKTLYITAGTSVYRIKMATTGVKSYGGLQDDSYKLYANYPNPFNPSTVIAYHLAASDRVVLKVYDMLGNETSTLVDERQPSGTHHVAFNAERLVSGVYFYRLQAGSFTETKRLVVLR